MCEIEIKFYCLFVRDLSTSHPLVFLYLKKDVTNPPVLFEKVEENSVVV